MESKDRFFECNGYAFMLEKKSGNLFKMVGDALIEVKNPSVLSSTLFNLCDSGEEISHERALRIAGMESIKQEALTELRRLKSSDTYFECDGYAFMLDRKFHKLFRMSGDALIPVKNSSVLASILCDSGEEISRERALLIASED